jgi:hypothetical protein
MVHGVICECKDDMDSKLAESRSGRGWGLFVWAHSEEKGRGRLGEGDWARETGRERLGERDWAMDIVEDPQPLQIDLVKTTVGFG